MTPRGTFQKILGKAPRLLDPKIKTQFPSYVLQASIATLALGIILVIEDIVSGGAISRGILVAAIGSTAFILFITPHSDGARPRHALGGHLVALGVGAGIGFGISTQADLHLGVTAALAVGITMFLMAATDTEHGPAAGTAMAVSNQGFTWELALLLIVSVLFLVILHQCLRGRLRNLA